MSSFGDRLRKLRIENGLTLQELANLFNKAKSTMSTYENGKYEPSLDLILELSSYFNVSIDYLMGRTDQKSPFWLVNNNEKEQGEYIKVINQAKNKGLSPKELQTAIKIFEKIKVIIE